MFLICKSIYILKVHSIHYTLRQMLKKNSSDKTNGRKNAVFLLLQVPTYHSFSFNLQFLNDLKNCFSTRFVSLDSLLFLLKFIFLFNKMHGLFALQNENNRKATYKRNVLRLEVNGARKLAT